MSMVAMARPAPLTMQPIVAVERDVGQVVLGRLDFLGVLLGLVAQGEDVRMAIERVGVEDDLGVEHFSSPCLETISGLISSMAMSFATKAL